MKKIVLTIVFAMTAAAPASAQLDALKNKIKPKPTPTPQSGNSSGASSTSQDPVKYAADAKFLFIGANDIDGRKSSELRVCTEGHSLRYPIQDRFKQWISELSETSMLKMMQMGRCELLGYRIVDNPGYKHRNADSFGEEAQGKTIYEVRGEVMFAVKKFGSSDFYIVVVPEVAKAGLKLADLNLCGSPDTIKHYRRRVASVSNCHDLRQSIYTLESYKNYPGPMQRNSIILNATDFDSLKTQGKFKSFVVYKLVGDELIPSK